ncbi:MAG: hypothetical protein NVS3B21_32240 [Acidimicrobiales bacterium]
MAERMTRTGGEGDMDAGQQVEVRSRFEGRWVGGFAVSRVASGPDGAPQVWVKRESDGSQIPVPFGEGDVRIPGTTEHPVIERREQSA